MRHAWPTGFPRGHTQSWGQHFPHGHTAPAFAAISCLSPERPQPPWHRGRAGLCRGRRDTGCPCQSTHLAKGHGRHSRQTELSEEPGYTTAGQWRCLVCREGTGPAWHSRGHTVYCPTRGGRASGAGGCGARRVPECPRTHHRLSETPSTAQVTVPEESPPRPPPLRRPLGGARAPRRHRSLSLSRSPEETS